MTDIALTWKQFAADFSIFQNDLLTDEGLETAVLISLFTDRRCNADDAIPDGSNNRRGWWADEFSVGNLNLGSSDFIGSRLWLLSREKQLDIVLRKAEEYAKEALQWMIEDKITDRIEVIAESKTPDILAIQVSIYRPKNNNAQFKYDYNWTAQALKVA